jgi:hypothetical protein
MYKSAWHFSIAQYIIRNLHVPNWHILCATSMLLSSCLVDYNPNKLQNDLILCHAICVVDSARSFMLCLWLWVSMSSFRNSRNLPGSPVTGINSVVLYFQSFQVCRDVTKRILIILPPLTLVSLSLNLSLFNQQGTFLQGMVDVQTKRCGF